MFSFISGVKPWEWALLGALGLAILALWNGLDYYNDARVDKGVALEQLRQAQASAAVQTKISSITDQVVADAYNANVKNQADLVVSRHGVIDEYLAEPEVQAVAPAVPTVKPAAPAVAAHPPTAKPVPARKSTVPTQRPAAQLAAARRPVDNPVQRLTRLADSMQQRFCAALPTDPGCQRAKSPPGAVPG